MSIIAILIFSVIIPLIIYYRINYGKMKDIMLMNNIDFKSNIYNMKNLYTLIKVLKDKVINNNSDRVFLKKMLISITLSIVFLIFYTIILYLFPDLLFGD